MDCDAPRAANSSFCVNYQPAASKERTDTYADGYVRGTRTSLGGGGVLAATEGTKDGPVVPAPALTLAGGLSERRERTNAAKGGTVHQTQKR